ncbi:hypothetical protein CSUI_001447, partial [Cystoisospora suis]
MPPPKKRACRRWPFVPSERFPAYPSILPRIRSLICEQRNLLKEKLLHRRLQQHEGVRFLFERSEESFCPREDEEEEEQGQGEQVAILLTHHEKEEDEQEEDLKRKRHEDEEDQDVDERDGILHFREVDSSSSSLSLAPADCSSSASSSDSQNEDAQKLSSSFSGSASSSSSASSPYSTQGGEESARFSASTSSSKDARHPTCERPRGLKKEKKKEKTDNDEEEAKKKKKTVKEEEDGDGYEAGKNQVETRGGKGGVGEEENEDVSDVRNASQEPNQSISSSSTLPFSVESSRKRKTVRHDREEDSNEESGSNLPSGLKIKEEKEGEGDKMTLSLSRHGQTVSRVLNPTGEEGSCHLHQSSSSSSPTHSRLGSITSEISSYSSSSSSLSSSSSSTISSCLLSTSNFESARGSLLETSSTSPGALINTSQQGEQQEEEQGVALEGDQGASSSSFVLEGDSSLFSSLLSGHSRHLSGLNGPYSSSSDCLDKSTSLLHPLSDTSAAYCVDSKKERRQMGATTLGKLYISNKRFLPPRSEPERALRLNHLERQLRLKRRLHGCLLKTLGEINRQYEDLLLQDFDEERQEAFVEEANEFDVHAIRQQGLLADMHAKMLKLRTSQRLDRERKLQHERLARQRCRERRRRAQREEVEHVTSGASPAILMKELTTLSTFVAGGMPTGVATAALRGGNRLTTAATTTSSTTASSSAPAPPPPCSLGSAGSSGSIPSSLSSAAGGIGNAGHSLTSSATGTTRDDEDLRSHLHRSVAGPGSRGEAGVFKGG